jgi:ribosomal protein S27AE
MGVTFPAFCPACGLIFESRMFPIEGNVEGLTLSENREQCPRCRNWAEYPTAP